MLSSPKICSLMAYLHPNMGWLDGSCDMDSGAVHLTPFATEIQGTMPERV